MITDLLYLLIVIIVLGLVFYLLYWMIGQIPMPQPFRTAAVVILCLITVLVLLGILFGGINLPRLRI